MGYDMRPLDNFINSVYGGAVESVMEAALRLMLNDPPEDKMEALIHFTDVHRLYHNTLGEELWARRRPPTARLPLACLQLCLGMMKQKYVKNRQYLKPLSTIFTTQYPGQLTALYGSENMVFMSFNPRRY